MIKAEEDIKKSIRCFNCGRQLFIFQEKKVRLNIRMGKNEDSILSVKCDKCAKVNFFSLQ